MPDFNSEQRIFQYDTSELRKIALVIRKMGEEAQIQAREITGSLVEFATQEIKQAARSTQRSKQATRIADGVRISKTSVIGEFSLGFAGQKFSGGATTQLNQGMEKGLGILAGVEFGARKQKQFLPRTPKFGIRGNSGYFIYPTLRRIQPDIIKKWEESFNQVIKEWDK